MCSLREPQLQKQPEFLTVLNLESAIPANHPLRGIKQRVDQVLQKLSPLLDRLYGQTGRPSIPPEQLLKARLLMALYSVRSERLFCEQLGYNLLWLWFLDRELAEGSFNHSVFAKNYQRLLSAEVARRFFEEVYELSRQEGWASDEHFTVDGTLIESWASLKSFVRKDGADRERVEAARRRDRGNPEVDFRGQQRSNRTHRSQTDPESVLYRKGPGKEARLCFGAAVLMENRHGLCAEVTIHNPIAEPEAKVALRQLRRRGRRARTVGADKGYHRRDFVAGCREAGVAPHVACRRGLKVPGLDGRTTNRRGYRLSQRVRKRVEEIFGWMKTVGGLRRSRYRGMERTQAWAWMVASAYNLLRMTRLSLGLAG